MRSTPVVYPLVAWGAMVAAHGLLVHFAFGGGKRWEENKLRELMGWSATQQDLARLSERIETLLRIVSDERDRRLAPDLESARDRLLDAESAIRHYRAPLSETDVASMSKRDVIELVERLEALLTSRRFQQLDEAAERDVERDSAPKH